MTKAVESGMPKLRIEEAAARRQARVDRGEDVIVGVNKYRPRRGAGRSTSATSTTPRCASSRSRGSRHVRETRDEAACQAALRRLTEGAAGNGNLLELSIEAARARATVGEISDAMEQVFSRHRATIRTISGVYGGPTRATRATTRSATRSRSSPTPRAAVRACSSSRWARTATTAAPR